MDEILTLKESDMISLVMQGEKIAVIARKLSVNRNTIYNWLNKESVKAELSRRKQEVKSRADRQILTDVGSYIDNIKYLAGDKTDKRVMLAANRYLLDRAMGLIPRGSDDGDIDDDSVDVITLRERLREFKIKRK